MRRRPYPLIIIGLLVAISASEMAARRFLGLGHPPLSVTHSTIEYMFAPNQDVYRFGNHIFINEFGMRNENLQPKREGEFRAIVMGDSVVNGGNLTDHANLATSLLTDENDLYLNVSAGSWGVENMVEYIQEFGTFDADEIILVLSSHDAWDIRTFEPLDPLTHPTNDPPFALWEGITRYLPKYLPQAAKADKPWPSTAIPAKVQAALAVLKSLADSRDVPICLVLHRERGGSRPELIRVGHDLLVAMAQRLSIPTVEASDYISPAGYRDNIHLTEAGQAQLSFALKACRAMTSEPKVSTSQ